MSETDELAAATQRGVLGVLLAVLGLVGAALARGIVSGSPLTGAFGLLLALGAGSWIVVLFREGLAAR